jgi:hypothetical protein
LLFTGAAKGSSARRRFEPWKILVGAERLSSLHDTQPSATVRVLAALFASGSRG